MDMLKSMQQEMQRRNQSDDARAQKDDIRDKIIQSLTNQMGQLQRMWQISRRTRINFQVTLR